MTNPLWPNQNAVFLSQHNNVALMINQLIMSKGWKISLVTESLKEAQEEITSRRASVLIIDDYSENPSPAIVRQIITNPFLLMTPTLVFILKPHLGEAHLIENIAKIQIIPKPLTPSRFLPGFHALLKTWERKTLVLLRTAVKQVLANRLDPEHTIHILRKFEKAPECRVLVSPAIAMLLKQQQQIKAAESQLFSTLKANPQQLTSMLILGDLYMQAAMPHLAFRIFNGIAKANKHSAFILPDLIQAHLLMNDFKRANELFESMVHADYLYDESSLGYSKSLIITNQYEKAREVMKERPGLYKKLLESWQQHDPQLKAESQATHSKAS